MIPQCTAPCDECGDSARVPTFSLPWGESSTTVSIAVCWSMLSPNHHLATSWGFHCATCAGLWDARTNKVIEWLLSCVDGARSETTTHQHLATFWSQAFKLSSGTTFGVHGFLVPQQNRRDLKLNCLRLFDYIHIVPRERRHITFHIVYFVLGVFRKGPFGPPKVQASREPNNNYSHSSPDAL